MTNILYKGNPYNINYKILKKSIVKDPLYKIDPDVIRNKYKELINSDKREFCIIYKEK